MAEMSIDGKSTLTYWGLELEECYVTAPERKTFMLDIPGGNGQIDAMRGLCDPVYAMRTLTAVFKITEPKPPGYGFTAPGRTGRS